MNKRNKSGSRKEAIHCIAVSEISYVHTIMRPTKIHLLPVIAFWEGGKIFIYFYNCRHLVFVFISLEVVIVTVKNGIRVTAYKRKISV